MGLFALFSTLKARFSGRGTCSPGSLAPGGAGWLLPDYFLNLHQRALWYTPDVNEPVRPGLQTRSDIQNPLMSFK